MRAGLWLHGGLLGAGLVVVVAGCRPTPDPAPPSPSPSPSPVPAAPTEDTTEPRGPKPSPGPSPTAVTKPEPEPPERSTTPTSAGSACELSCADVHACLLVEGRDHAAAAAIELGCLDACLRAPEAFARCDRPTPVDAVRCTDALACAHAAWPAPDQHAPAVDAPASDGCGLACAALAHCHDQPTRAADECAKQCREILTDAQQQSARGCAAQEGCRAIEDCVLALPGA